MTDYFVKGLMFWAGFNTPDIIMTALTLAGVMLFLFWYPTRGEVKENNTAKAVIIISNQAHGKGVQEQMEAEERNKKLKEHQTSSDHGKVKRYGHFVKQWYSCWADCWGRYETMRDAMEAVRIAGTGFVDNLANPAV